MPAARWIGADGQRMLCASCREREAKVNGRCPACMNYLRRHGHDRRPGELPRGYKHRPPRRKHRPLTSPPNELEERLGGLYVAFSAHGPVSSEGRRFETLTQAEYNSLSDSARRELLVREYAGVPRAPGERRRAGAGTPTLRAG